MPILGASTTSTTTVRDKVRSTSNDFLEMEGGFSPTNSGSNSSHQHNPLKFASAKHHHNSLHDMSDSSPSSSSVASVNGVRTNPDAKSIDDIPTNLPHPLVMQNKFRSWSRHLMLYTILGNIGMLLTVVSDNEMGVLSPVFCIGTYCHVFMEGSLLIRLLFPPSRNYNLQKLHNYWGIVTVFALLFFGNNNGELLWAAESILTDSMSLILGAWLIQADVSPQVKLLGISHFIHGVNFEFFLWFDIAALSASYERMRGIFWVILVVCNATAQVVFHGPVILGRLAPSNKPSTPSPQARKKLVWLWLCHNIFSIPLVLVFSTLGGNHFYLEETTVLPLYQWMIYIVPLTGLMIILGIYLKSTHAPYISLAEENSVDNIGKPVAFEREFGATLPTTAQKSLQNKISASRALAEVFSGVSGSMVHAAFQLLLGAVRFDSRPSFSLALFFFLFFR